MAIITRRVANVAAVAVMAFGLTACESPISPTPDPIPNPPPGGGEQEPPVPLVDSVELVAPPGAPGSVCGTTQRLGSPGPGGNRTWILVRYTTTRTGNWETRTGGSISVGLAVNGVRVGQGGGFFMETAEGVVNVIVSANTPGLTNQVYVDFFDETLREVFFGPVFIPCEITWE